ncbi:MULTISPECIES: hypothetical protein [Bacillaceae]|jgi:hypothetical protein|uniref:hypothetical protein n=1 Tax=Bacillaceae TaxID=186817 RepID=UPI000A2ABC1D|nr:hypothetical protein [Bacillus sp. OV166]SMQ76629.1 hypothetical protein SAMN05444673_2683 [Bacillus sp. OV166]
MKKRLKVLLGMSIMSMFLFGAVAFAATDFTLLGFSKVVAERKIEAGAAAKLSHSGIKIQIPEGAFTHDVTFQVLEGDNSKFQKVAPSGETVIMNFAFRVIDLETGQIIDRFNNKQLTFSFKDKDINKGSIYYNFKGDGTIANNNAQSVIDGRTLTHPVGAAPVGWFITSPTESINK